MITYFSIGLIWCAWLEYYTTKHGVMPDNRAWTLRERLFNVTAWPVSLCVFVATFINNLPK